ncbi:WbqC family protein [Flavimarina sp. Hel_I_48]|uniref:WbqC family protein n=1 Tax=Flavimarina sp. Hel_I_48 TaxID=1392488 RepID=UPI0004DFCB3E|nr:WbqC family protein [Flavimarina sp. Hel_I_48]
MKIAVMQPYIFPYVGYFQLIQAVDTFVFFDDVQFKRRSYITRNSILINDKANTFSIPVQKANRDANINEIALHEETFNSWAEKFLKSLHHAYAKAPYFESVFKLIQGVFKEGSADIASLTKRSIQKTCQYLNLKTEFKSSASIPYEKSGDGQDKILSICGFLEANTYINAINGRDLYNSEAFEKKGTNLLFLEPNVAKYEQFSANFTSHLSIIDMMMFLSPQEIAAHLKQYQLITD